MTERSTVASKAASTAASTATPPPRTVRCAFVLVLVGTVAVMVSAVLSALDRLATVPTVTVWSDLALSEAFIVLYLFFAAMMAKGRQWGRVVLGAVLIPSGIGFTFAGLAGTGTGPLHGPTQVGLGLLGLATSAGALALMFSRSANAFFREVGPARRLIAPRPRKILFAAHVAVSVAWLGVVGCQFTLATAIAVSGDAKVQYAGFTMMALLDNVFLGVTSTFAVITGLVHAVGTRWGLMQRRWVAAKFYATLAVQMVGFAVIHQSIQKGNLIETAGDTPVRTAETDALGVLLSCVTGAAMLTLISMVIISVFKPWGFTRRGRRTARTVKGRPDRSGRSGRARTRPPTVDAVDTVDAARVADPELEVEPV
jgi:hypothetical protein